MLILAVAGCGADRSAPTDPPPANHVLLAAVEEAGAYPEIVVYADGRVIVRTDRDDPVPSFATLQLDADERSELDHDISETLALDNIASTYAPTWDTENENLTLIFSKGPGGTVAFAIPDWDLHTPPEIDYVGLKLPAPLVRLRERLRLLTSSSQMEPWEPEGWTLELRRATPPIRVVPVDWPEGKVLLPPPIQPNTPGRRALTLSASQFARVRDAVRNQDYLRIDSLTWIAEVICPLPGWRTATSQFDATSPELLASSIGLLTGDELIPQQTALDHLRTLPSLILEGLPHPNWEAPLVAEERRRTPFTEIGGNAFYATPLAWLPEDREHFLEIYANPYSHGPRAGLKACGGFHADYAITWEINGTAQTLMMCFGCGDWALHDGSTLHYWNLPRHTRNQLIELFKPYNRQRPRPKKPDSALAPRRQLPPAHVPITIETTPVFPAPR